MHTPYATITNRWLGGKKVYLYTCTWNSNPLDPLPPSWRNVLSTCSISVQKTQHASKISIINMVQPYHHTVISVMSASVISRSPETLCTYESMWPNKKVSVLNSKSKVLKFNFQDWSCVELLGKFGIPDCLNQFCPKAYLGHRMGHTNFLVYLDILMLWIWWQWILKDHS